MTFTKYQTSFVTIAFQKIIQSDSLNRRFVNLSGTSSSITTPSVDLSSYLTERETVRLFTFISNLSGNTVTVTPIHSGGPDYTILLIVISTYLKLYRVTSNTRKVKFNQKSFWRDYQSLNRRTHKTVQETSSSSGAHSCDIIGKNKLHLYLSLGLPFPRPQ